MIRGSTGHYPLKLVRLWSVRRTPTKCAALSDYRFLYSHTPTRIHTILCCAKTPDNNCKRQTPQILKVAVTEVLRLLSSFNPTTTARVDKGNDKLRDDFPVVSVDDVVMILEADYKNAYVVTGTELYARNLKLLVPFFDSPSIGLEKIGKDLPEAPMESWRPLISIDGSTVYDLDDKFKIVRHAESWNVSAIEAVGQIFRPCGRSND